MFCQEKRDATTGEHLKDKARLAMLGNLEIQAGEHTNPLKNYCPTLGAIGLRYLIANAAWKGFEVSKSDSKQSFQHTPTTRPQPDVIWLEKELKGAETDGFYCLTTLFQGLPEANRAWYDYTA